MFEQETDLQAIDQDLDGMPRRRLSVSLIRVSAFFEYFVNC